MHRATSLRIVGQVLYTIVQGVHGHHCEVWPLNRKPPHAVSVSNQGVVTLFPSRIVDDLSLSHSAYRTICNRDQDF